MPVNVVCPILGTPVKSDIWCKMTYSVWAHVCIKQDGLSKVLDDLLESKGGAIKWEVKSVVATVRQFYPHALHDPRLEELVERHFLEDWVYKGGA